MSSSDPTPAAKPRPKAYVPTVGPRLRVALAIIFIGVAILGATGAYQAAITTMNALDPAHSYETPFTFWMIIVHTGVGIVFLIPFVAFCLGHYFQARNRPNKVAVRLGLLVFAAGTLVGLTGLALIQLEGMPQLPTRSWSRIIAYVLHVALPVVAIALYLGHRRAGPKIRWSWGYAWAIGTGAFVLVMVIMHRIDPRDLFAKAPREGEKYFHPSEARTATGNFIPAKALMMDEYCKKCHADIYDDHFHSAHKFSSFNNPPYLFSVRETREVSLKRDGNVQPSRWCAGCHDPVPFFSGAFDNPKFDDVNDPTAHAGITCTVCHSMTQIHSTMGNAAYTIEEPQHYPFAYSDNAFLQWINNQLVKAKPDFHKRTFLKPFHKSADFCSTCHKVHLPVALNHYKDFLRGQNHHDSFTLSGVSGGGTRSFYYPPQAKANCAECHMPLKPSADFGSKDFDNSGTRKVHNHFFPGANTGLPFLLSLDPRHKDKAEGLRQAIQTNADFLRGTDPEGKDKKLRIDLFGLKRDGSTRPEALIAPLRPTLPTLQPGKSYLVEVVIRNLLVGHHFPQGTADSNEIWVDFKAESGGKVIAHNGALADEAKQEGPVDEWAHFIMVLMLDRHGNRINRRNPQDIFTPLYDHQIPPGSAQVVHYKLDVPADATGPIRLSTRLRYRKFDYEYMKIVHKGGEVPRLPIIDLCSDEVTLPVEGGPAVADQKSGIPLWQRWNDYGIGCLLEGPAGAKKGHFKQAAAAFRRVADLGVKEAVSHGHLNLARVLIEEGNYDAAAKALQDAARADPPANWWSLALFNNVVNSETATSRDHLDNVIAELETLLDPAKQPEKRTRGFDFSKDYVVINRLANRLFRRSQFEEPGSDAWRQFLVRAVKAGNRTLALDQEDVEAHDLLKQCFAALGRSFDAGEPVAASIEELAAAGRTLADHKQPRDVRLKAARKVAAGLDAQSGKEPDPKQPRLGTYRELVAKLNVAYTFEKDAELSAAIARALMSAHRESHLVYKPDENARSNTTRLYREKHPAANYAARDRVIYPTTPDHRKAIVEQGRLPGVE